MAGILYEYAERTSNLTHVEATAALLVITRIFHASLDYNYYKYDRHLEYYDYPVSPVGYYWKQLKDLVLKASQNTGVADPANWANEKLMKMIAGHNAQPTKIQEYMISCRGIFRRRLLNQIIPGMLAEKLLNNIANTQPVLWDKAQERSRYFNRFEVEFLKDCLDSAGMEPRNE